MEELEFLRKLSECEDKERMQQAIEEYNNGHKPMTNADQIRAMRDEELEPTILAFKLGYAPWCDHHCENEGEYGCDTCILNWLKQPVEVSGDA